MATVRYDKATRIFPGTSRPAVDAQTDQESRSADPRAAASVTVMHITIHGTFLPHDDPDASLTFYRDRPEVDPAVLLLVRAGPG
jgi:hypothetical protein